MQMHNHMDSVPFGRTQIRLLYFTQRRCMLLTRSAGRISYTHAIGASQQPPANASEIPPGKVCLQSVKLFIDQRSSKRPLFVGLRSLFRTGKPYLLTILTVWLNEGGG